MNKEGGAQQKEEAGEEQKGLHIEEIYKFTAALKPLLTAEAKPRYIVIYLLLYLLFTKRLIYLFVCLFVLQPSRPSCAQGARLASTTSWAEWCPTSCGPSAQIDPTTYAVLSLSLVPDLFLETGWHSLAQRLQFDGDLLVLAISAVDGDNVTTRSFRFRTSPPPYLSNTQ